MTKFDSLVCHLCNTPGTESCDEIYATCLCKPWYEGEYCQNCRFSRDYVLAPNGSCIPCNCGLRSIYECFQNNLCMKFAGESVREAVAVSALFLSAIATITCLSVCIVWRIITKSKQLKPTTLDYYEDGGEEGEFENGTAVPSSRPDSTSAAISIGNGQDDEWENTNDRKRLLTPNKSGGRDSEPSINRHATVQLFPYTSSENKKSASAKFRNNNSQKNKFDHFTKNPNLLDTIKANGENLNSALANEIECTKYYFLNVRCEGVGEDEFEEMAV